MSGIFLGLNWEMAVIEVAVVMIIQSGIVCYIYALRMGAAGSCYMYISGYQLDPSVPVRSPINSYPIMLIDFLHL